MESKWVAHKPPSSTASGGDGATMKKRMSVTGLARVVKRARSSEEALKGTADATPATAEDTSAVAVAATARAASTAIASTASSAAPAAVGAGTTGTGDAAVRTIRPKVVLRCADTSSIADRPTATAEEEQRGRRATINAGTVQPDWLRKQAPTLQDARLTSGGALGPPAGLSPEVVARRQASRRSLVVNSKDLIVSRAAAAAPATAAKEGESRAPARVIVTRSRQQRVETVFGGKPAIPAVVLPSPSAPAALAVLAPPAVSPAGGNVAKETETQKEQDNDAMRQEFAVDATGEELRTTEIYGASSMQQEKTGKEEAKIGSTAPVVTFGIGDEKENGEAVIMAEIEESTSAPGRVGSPPPSDSEGKDGQEDKEIEEPGTPAKKETVDVLNENEGSRAREEKEDSGKKKEDTSKKKDATPKREKTDERKSDKSTKKERAETKKEKADAKKAEAKREKKDAEEPAAEAVAEVNAEESNEKGKLSRITSKKKLSWIKHGLQKAKRGSTTNVALGQDSSEQKDAGKQEAVAKGSTAKQEASSKQDAASKPTPAAVPVATASTDAPASGTSSCVGNGRDTSPGTAAAEQPQAGTTLVVAELTAMPTEGGPEQRGEDVALEKLRATHEGKTREDKRQEILQEVVDTEESYFSDLGVLMKVFLEPIRKQELLTKQQISSVFANLEAIYPVNEGMLAALRELQEGKAETSIGEIFVERSVLFKLYAVYCSNQPNIRDRILALKKELPEFDDFLKKQFRRPECRKLDLEAFLIKPLQRLCKYPLLIKELLKNTGSDHPEFAVLHQARTEISAIVTKVNERVRQVENLNKLIAITKEVEEANSVEIVVHNRAFVHEGPLTINKRLCYCYLFSDSFLICRVKKKKEEDVREVSRLAPLTMLSVADLEDVDDAKNRFEIAEVGHKIRVARAGSRIKKKQWLKHLQTCISAVEVNEADKQRALNTLRRLSRDPVPAPSVPKPSDSGKGGSRIALKDSVKKLTENWEQRAKEPDVKSAPTGPVMIDPRIKKMSTAEKERRIVELERTLEAFKVRCIEMKGALKQEKDARFVAEKRVSHLQEVLASTTEPQQALHSARRGSLLAESVSDGHDCKEEEGESSSERLNTLNNMVDKITEENVRLRQKLKAAKSYVAGLEERLRNVPVEAYQPTEEQLAAEEHP